MRKAPHLMEPGRGNDRLHDRNEMTATKRACHYCKSTTRRLTRDHIVPLSRGGADKLWNIVPACQPCNEAKASDWPTCECATCAGAVERQPWAWMRSLNARPHQIPPKPPERAGGGGGPRCLDCGEITMTPKACPWCGNEVIA